MLIPALAMALLQSAAATTFAPPLDQPLLLTTERVETEGSERRSYRIQVRMRFARDGDGYRAELVVVEAGGAAGRMESAMFETGLSGLAGRTIRFRLDRAGRVVAITDRAELWHDFCVGLARVMAASKAADPDARARLEARFVAPLEALPPERQIALLASLLTPAFASEAGDQPAGSTRAVRLPGRSAYGGAAPLDGARTVSRGADIQRVVTRAHGTVPAPDGSPARIVLTIEERSDPATGLILQRRETRETQRAADGRRMAAVKTITLGPAPVE
ncbi:MAG: hypothetical protein ACOY45_07965 [Pseudomonadota bacterium]